MGYKSTDKKEREGQDLVYEGEVNPVVVLETATDLLVMREEIGLIQNLVKHLIHEKRDEGVMLELVVSVRQNTNTYDESWAKMVQIGYAEDKSGIYANLPFIGALQNRGGSNRISEGTTTEADLHERYHQQQQQEQQLQQQQPQQQQQALYANAPLLQDPSRNVPAWKMFDNVPPSQHTQPSASSSQMASHMQASQLEYAGHQHGSQSSPHPLFHQQPQPSQQQQAAYPPQPTVPCSQPPPSSGQQQAMASSEAQRRQQFASHHQPGYDWQGERASNPTQYVNHPPMTQNENYGQNVASQSPIRNAPGPGYPGQNPHHPNHPGYNAVSSTHSRAQNTYTPDTREAGQHMQQLKYAAQPSRESDDSGSPETMNIQRQMMDKGRNLQSQRGRAEQGSSQSLSESSGSVEETMNQSINPDDLPAPIFDFTSPTESTAPQTLNCESGLVSCIVNPRSSEGSIGFPSLLDGGPQALKIEDQLDESAEQKHDAYCPGGIAKSSSSESNLSSIDIYGSGPTTHRQFSAPSYVPTVPEEPGWDMVSASDVPPDGVAAPPHPTPRSTKPALMTQGSQDKQPHALESEAVASQLKEAPYPKPRKLRNKTQSVDEAEDHNRGERRHHGMKTCQSGPNLLELENNSQTLDETSPQKLKPKPRPRASRSPSPVSSPENSPSNSPVARRRNPQPPTDEQSSPSPSPRLKARPGGMLPKTRSIDTETQQRHGNREMNRILHFSSGSNIRQPAQTTREPETPVMGIIPATLMKKFPKPSQTGEVPPSKPTLRDVLPTEQDSNEMTHTSQAAVSPSQQVSHHQLASSMRSSDQPMQSSGSTPQPKEPTPPKVTSPTDRSKPPFQLHKSQPHVSPTMATADTGLTSESDQSRLDYGGDGARSLRQNLNQDRKKSQGYSDPIMRERANATSRGSGNKSLKSESAPATDKTSFTEDDTAKDASPGNKTGFEDTLTELQMKYNINLEETWVCSYCTNLVPISEPNCDVCHSPRTTMC